jgi:hypothetical protein
VGGIVGWLAALLWLAALGVTPTPASAAPAIVQQQIATSATSTVTSLSVTPTTTTVGNVLVMIGANWGCNLLSVSGGGVTTWQRAAYSTSNSNVEIWYGVVDTASSAAVVATLNTQASPAGCGSTASGAQWMNFTEWSGLWAAVDAANAQAGSTSSASAPSITTTNASDLLLFGATESTSNSFGASPTPGTWTAMTSPTATWTKQSSWYQNVAASGAYQPAVTDSGSTFRWEAAIAAFKACPATVSDPSYVTANAQNGQVNVYWSTPNQVMIARNTTNSFGTPANGTAYAVSAALPTAGTVIFNGAAGTFNESIANGTYYYKVFTNCGRTYSAGATLTVIPGNGNTALWSFVTQVTTLAAPGIDDNYAVVWGDNNGKLYGANAGDGTLKYPVFTSPTNSIQSRPSLIPASYSVTGVNVAYVSALDGYVYAVNTGTGAQLWKSTVPAVNNQLVGGPAIWLKAIQALAICGALTDVVFVGQRNTGTTTGNSVYALNGGTSNVTSNGVGNCNPSNPVVPGGYLWKFTGGGTNPNMDSIVSTPFVDYTNNVLWVTSNAASGVGQPSLWKFNVQNGLLANGTAACGTGAATSCWNLGHTDNPPSMSGDGSWIYVGTNCIPAGCATQAATLNAVQISTGTVKTYNPGTGGVNGTGNIRGPYPLRWTSFGTTSTIARVNNNITVQNTSQATCQVSLAMTAGNTAIVVVTAPSNFNGISPNWKITGVTDTSNNLYSRRAYQGVTAGPVGVQIWSATIGATGTVTVTANFGGSIVSTCSLAQYSGVGAIGSPANNFSTSSTNPTVSNTNAGVTTFDTNNWVVAGFATAGTSLATSLTGTLLQTTTITGLAMALTDNSIAAQGGTWTNAITYAKKAWGAAAVELRSVSADQIVYSRDQTMHAVQFTGSLGQFNQVWGLQPNVNVGTPVDDGAGRLWVGAGQGIIYQLDAWSGIQGIWWKSITPAASTVQLGDVSFDGISNRIYIGGSDGRVYGINVPY